MQVLAVWRVDQVLVALRGQHDGLADGFVLGCRSFLTLRRKVALHVVN